MSTYAIGDVQGCFDELLDLLARVDFNPQKDVIWFTGDLVNRGPQSLETLRFVKSLGKSAISVLGNHDLHYLAVAAQCETLKKKDTFQDVLIADDAQELVNWVKTFPLVHYDEKLGFAMVHAGLAPQWTLKNALDYSRELEIILQGSDCHYFLQHMYGDTPGRWDDSLTGIERWRLIVNYTTRMRYVKQDGTLDLECKGPVGGQPKGFYPWFLAPKRVNQSLKIIFGHWASLKGKADTPNIYALDTGCSWGNTLTAMRLEDEKFFYTNCSKQRS